MARIDDIPAHTILDVCSDGALLNAYTLRRIFVKIIQAHYTQASNFGQVPDDFKKFVWSEDKRKSKLTIELDNLQDDWKIEQRPAIFVGLGDADFKKNTINNFMEDRDDMAGKLFAQWGQTTLICSHKAKHADDALMLSVITKDFLRAIREALKDSLRISPFEVVKQTSPKQIKPDKGDRHYESVVTVNMAYSDAWEVNVESHVIKRINIKGRHQTC